MLEQVLDFIHTYFIKEVYRGKFKIELGVLNIDFLKENQYFKIKGSIFNDGLHRYPDNTLMDEEFQGEIWALAIPLAVIKIAEEIKTYVDEYGSKIDGPYQSESFGGYSYSKSNGTDNHGNDINSWQSKFSNRLNHWRKIS